MSQRSVVVILAAGLGTRMKSRRAKVLFEVAGRPLIVWAVETARAAGAERVIAVLGHQHEEVTRVLEERYGEGAVEVALQPEQRGTGHAVLCALPALDGEPDDRTVAILTGDAPLLGAERVAELVDASARSGARMALLSTRPARPVPYGRLVRDSAGTLLRIVEHRDATPEERQIDELNAGFYAIRLRELREDVRRLTADNAQGELYLTDLAERAAARGGAAVLEAPFAEVSGVNDRVDLAEVDAEARRRINRDHMLAGVTLAAPAQIFIDADAGPIGADSSLGPGVHLRGRTRIGERVRIDAGCVLRDAAVDDDAVLLPYSVVEGTAIGARARVGPFARLRPGTRLEEEVVVGNFVETRRAHFSAGARAEHHAYLGEVAVGALAEIGAGAITCDHDGVTEHRTVIEAGAFVGSGSQLVAPVTVGKNAYVGAGSTVTKDVPRAGLALTRVKQVNVDGWAGRFREAKGKRVRPPTASE